MNVFCTISCPLFLFSQIQFFQFLFLEIQFLSILIFILLPKQVYFQC